MENLKKKLLKKAKEASHVVVPCETRKKSCFTVEGDELWFWYNDEMGSTRVVSEKLRVSDENNQDQTNRESFGSSRAWF
jgi:hypothetical protein